MTSSPDAFTPPTERLEDLQRRIEHCRIQAQELSQRWSAATRRVGSLPEPRRCNHAVEADELRRALVALEQEVAGLHTALETRGVIDQAKGMIMLRERCSAEQAFQMLVRVSQTTHRKLHDVAAALVETTVAGADGHP